MILRTAKPTKILYHLVTILARMTTVNETVISIPCKLKNPAILPSKTPMPNGKNVITPKMIDAVYIETKVNNSTLSIPNDNSNKCIAIHSTNQKNIESVTQ